MNIKQVKCLVVAACLVLGACSPASRHAKSVKNDTADRITVGKVQREIRVGMTTGQVVEALGQPNLVTTDSDRREQWVYEKIATDTAYSSSAGGFNALFLGYGKSTGATSTNQRTLTVIVKFDEQNHVRDFAYHNSSF